MKRISRDNVIYHMNKDNKPSDRVQPGETLVFETYDCFTNQLLTKEMHEIDASLTNPSTGPVYVEGAKPGDALRVEILDIKCGPLGFLETHDFKGRVGSKIKGAVVERYKIEGNKLFFDETEPLDIKPMVGVIGTAPGNESINTMIPGTHGSNMDCTEVKPGAIVYLPVYVEGGLLAMGDIHALMGDGETGKTGLEVDGEVTVKVDIVKGFKVDCPIIVADNKLTVVSSAKTLDQACDDSTGLMSDFMEVEVGLDTMKGIFLITMLGDLKVCQVVNPLVTAAMSFPLDILQKYGFQLR